MLEAAKHQETNDEEENVFFKAFIPRNLNQVYDVERDIARLGKGQTEEILYGKLTGLQLFDSQEESDQEGDDDQEGNDQERGLDSGSSSANSSEDETSHPSLSPEEQRERQKAHKKAVKTENRERRKLKMKKVDKQRKIKQSQGKHKK